MYLLSAYFDEKANRILQRYIQNIADVSGNCFMIDNQVPPHLTISAIESRKTEPLLISLMDTMTGVYQGKIQIVSIGALFPYVLYATPVLNLYLQELSQSIYEAIHSLMLENSIQQDSNTNNNIHINKFYIPTQWFPHITLGKKLEEHQMQAAFQTMQKKFAPLEATIKSIGLAKTNPHQNIYIWNLPEHKL